MPLFSLHSAFDEVVEEATPTEIPESDAAVIAKFLPVADKINACAPGSKAKSNACNDAIRSTWKRVKSTDPLIGLHGVSLLDFLVKNCGVQFLSAFDDREFVLKMRDFVKSRLEDNNFNNKTSRQRQVAEALKARIQEWAEGEMKHISWIPVGPFEERKKERSNVRGLYNVLRRQGYAFPLVHPPPPPVSETARESEFERREREELEMAIQASLNEVNTQQNQQACLYPTQQLASFTESTGIQHTEKQKYHKHGNNYHNPRQPLPQQLQQQHPKQQPPQQQQQNLKQQHKPRSPTKRLVHALYDFEAMESDELTLRAGDVISVRSATDDNWWRGKAVESGKEGLFPASFVEEGVGKGYSKSPKTEAKKRSKSSEKAATPSNAKAAESRDATAKTPLAAEAAAVPKIDEEKIKMALHLIQQINPTEPKEEEEELKLIALEAECESMSATINQELETTDRQHLQLMQLNGKMADAMQMYHFLMVSEVSKPDSTANH